MKPAPVDLLVGGQTFRVVATAQPGMLRELAALVDEKLQELPLGDAQGPRGMFLAAMMLAHDLMEERARRAETEAKARRVLMELVGRVDAVLDECDGEDVTPAAPRAERGERPSR